MTKTYAIQVLDAAGDVILSTRGRAGTLAKAIEAQRDYAAACVRASGMLYTHAKDLKDGLLIDGVRVHHAIHLDQADDLVAGFDRHGVADYEARCKAALDQVAEERDAA